MVQPVGKLRLTKVQFITSTPVYRDKPESETKNPVVYEIKEGNDTVHWTSNESLYKKNGFPESIPIAVHSCEKFKIKAWFEVEGSLNVEPLVAVSIPNLPKYTFACDCQKGKAAGKFALTFEVSNTPYEDEVMYISELYVSFCYQVKMDEWQPAGCSRNKLYMTWREPEYSNTKCESLFYLSCKQGYKSRKRDASLSDDDWANSELKNIADSIFENFTSRKTQRVDETFADGMGYWRGISAVNSKKEVYDESLACFIDLGEGTCGDWARLFLSLIQIHGFKKFNQFATYSPSRVLAKGFNIYTPAYSIARKPASNRVRSFKNIAIRAKNVFRKIHADDSKPENYVHYNELVPSLFLIKNWYLDDYADKNSKYPPKLDLPVKAQGNNNPVAVFWDHVFVIIRTEDGAYWYDPSYGIKSSQAFYDSRQLVADYTKKTMSGILAAAIPKNKSKGSKMEENSSRLYIDLLTKEFKPEKEVLPYVYRVCKNGMADLIDYKYEQYVKEKCDNQDIVQIGYSKTYHPEHDDFQQIHEKFGYDINVQYINHCYRYYVVPPESNTNIEEALNDIRAIIPDSFKSKLSNIPSVSPEGFRSS